MQTFFHGWRRKVGVVSLVLACVLLLAWLRSCFVWEVICFYRRGRTHAIVAMGDSLMWQSWDRSELDGSSDIWQTFEPDEFDSVRSELAGIRRLYSLKEWCVNWQIPVTSLTLLSAYLILWEPRKRSSPGEMST